MAIYHLSLKGASRAGGKSAAAHGSYIARTGKYAKIDEKRSTTHVDYLTREGNYSARAQELRFTTHGNMPAFAKDNPQLFWKACDAFERKNARLYTELEVALPRELTEAQQISLATTFQKEVIGDKHPYSLCIHTPKALDGKVQPHFHLMFSERAHDGIERSAQDFFKRANPKNPDRGGNAKNRAWARKDKVEEVRILWEQIANAYLEKNGHHVRIDRRTLHAQGINRTPEPKMGPARTSLLKKGRHTNDGITETVTALRAIKKTTHTLEKVAHTQQKLLQKHEALCGRLANVALWNELVEEQKRKETGSLTTLDVTKELHHEKTALLTHYDHAYATYTQQVATHNECIQRRNESTEAFLKNTSPIIAQSYMHTKKVIQETEERIATLQQKQTALKTRHHNRSWLTKLFFHRHLLQETQRLSNEAHEQNHTLHAVKKYHQHMKFKVLTAQDEYAHKAAEYKQKIEQQQIHLMRIEQEIMTVHTLQSDLKRFRNENYQIKTIPSQILPHQVVRLKHESKVAERTTSQRMLLKLTHEQEAIKRQLREDFAMPGSTLSTLVKKQTERLEHLKTLYKKLPQDQSVDVLQNETRRMRPKSQKELEAQVDTHQRSYSMSLGYSR